MKVHDWLAGLGEAIKIKLREREYYDNPVLFIKEVLGRDLVPKQAFIANTLATPPHRVKVNSCNGFGKCLGRREIVTLANGSRVTAESLVGKDFELMTLVGGIPTTVFAKADWNQIEPVYELTTATGLRIVRNAKHPMFKGYGHFRDGTRPIIGQIGWEPLSSFKEGDLIATAECLPAFGEGDMPDEEIKILAYMIAEGGLTGNGCGFTQSPGVRLDEFCESVALVGCEAVSDGSDYGYRVRGTTGETYGRCNWKKNRVRELIRENGLNSKHLRDKFVPDSICRLPKEKIALFLSRMFGCDRWVTATELPRGRQQVEIGYCSASERLVRDVASLLIRFGIRPKVRYRENVRAWCCEFHTRDDIEIFVKEIGAYGKEEACDRALELISRRHGKLNWIIKKAPSGTRWDKVVSVRELPPEMTVAIEVPEHHTFLTDFYEHNTSVAADLAVWYYITRSPDCAVLMTAPTDRQVVEALGYEVRRAYGARGGMYPKQVKIEDTPGHLLLGFTASKEAAFAGIRRRRTFVIFDEHNGMAKTIYAATRGILTGDETYWLCLGNPTDPGSAAREEQLSGSWPSIITLSSFEHPNVPRELLGLPVLVAAAVRLGPLIENMNSWGMWVDGEGPETDIDLWDPDTYGLAEWSPEFLVEGPGGPEMMPELLAAIQRKFPARYWRPTKPEAFARILGQYPPKSAYSVWNEKLLDDARRNLTFPSPADRIIIACDVARYGDDATAIHARRGMASIHHESYYNRDTSHTAGRLKQLARELCEKFDPENDPEKVAIYIDDDGVGGGVTDQAGEFNFIPVKNAAVANDPVRYFLRRSEMQFAAVKWCESGLMDLTRLDEKSYQEIRRQAMAVEYKLDGQGRMVVEPKDEVKKPKRLGRSPDDLDAFAMCYGGASYASHKPTGRVIIDRRDMRNPGDGHRDLSRAGLPSDPGRTFQPGGAPPAMDIVSKYKRERR